MYVTNEDGITIVAKVSPPFELISENDLDDHAEFAGDLRRADIHSNEKLSLCHRGSEQEVGSANKVVWRRDRVGRIVTNVGQYTSQAYPFMVAEHVVFH